MITLHVYNVVRILKRHVVISLLMILLVSVCFTLLSEVTVQKEVVADEVEKYANTYGNKTYYFCSEGLSDVNYNTYLAEQNKSIYLKLANFLSLLRDENSITYVEMFPQGVAIAENFIPDIFLYNYENGHSQNSRFSINEVDYSMTKAIQVSPSYFDVFSANVDSGRKFREDEYIYSEGCTIPVILGSDYAEFFQIGDCFSARYLNKSVTLSVIGFLESGAFFCYSGASDYIACDRYIIMPSLSPTLEHPDNFYKIMLLQQLCGVIVSDIGYPETKKVYNKLLEDSNLVGWELYLRDPIGAQDINKRIAIYNEMTDDLKAQLTFLTISIAIFSVICISIVVCGFVNEHTYEFGVLLLNGARIKDLAIDVILVVALIIIAGTFLAHLYLYQIGIILSQTTFLLGFSIIILTSIMPVLKLTRIKTNELIGGKE